MKTILLLFILCFLFVPLNAQTITKERLNEISNGMERYQRTTPQWKQKYDLYISGGDYFVSIGEYKKAIKSYNLALKYVPRDPIALERRNYCQTELNNNKHSRK
jgi:hypothetical protein